MGRIIELLINIRGNLVGYFIEWFVCGGFTTHINSLVFSLTRYLPGMQAWVAMLHGVHMYVIVRICVFQVVSLHTSMMHLHSKHVCCVERLKIITFCLHIVSCVLECGRFNLQGQCSSNVCVVPNTVCVHDYPCFMNSYTIWVKECLPPPATHYVG